MARGSLLALLSAFVMVSCFSGAALAESSVRRSTGQELYVPIYSHIYAGNRNVPLLLTATLSIRNVAPRHSITVTAVDYYDTRGNLLEEYVARAVVLGPLQSLRYVIPQKDKSGGSGANFLLKWHAAEAVTPPLVESIMIGAEGQQGISFTSRAVVLAPPD